MDLPLGRLFSSDTYMHGSCGVHSKALGRISLVASFTDMVTLGRIHKDGISFLNGPAE